MDALSPFDFLPGYERDPEEEKRAKLRREVVKAIRYAMLDLKACTAEQVQEEKRRMIANMTAQGWEDAEGIFSEAYPEL